MSSLRDTIIQIIKYRERCIFCDSKLRTIVTNALSFNDCLSTLNADYKNEEFNFSFSYNSTSSDLHVSSKIDVKKNLLIFDKPIQSVYYDNGLCSQETLYKQAAWAFDKIAAHVESYCPSPKCGLNYYFCSNLFRIPMFNPTDTNQATFLITPVYLSAECFNIDDFWIQNDLVKYKTNIYSTKDINKNPVITDLIEFHPLNKEKLLNKIKMVTVFS